MEANAAALKRAHPFLFAASGVFFATLFSFLAIGAVLPVLPRYVHGPVGAGDVAVGMVIGAFAFTAVVTRPWAGRLADEHGRRMCVVWGSVLMAIAGALLFVDAGIGGLIFARLVVGLGEGFVFTAGSVWIVDLSPADRRGQSIGLFGLAVWGGLSAGPVIGEGLFAVGGYDLVWAFATAAPLIGALVAFRLTSGGALPPSDEPALPGEAGFLPRAAIAPGLALALANVGYATLAAFVGLHLAARGAGHGAAVFTAYAVSVVGSRLLLGRLPDRVGARRTAVGAGLAEALGLVLIALATEWWTAVAGGVVMGAGFSLLYPSLALVVIERVSVARRGAALGAFTAFFDAGVGLGAPLAGLIAAFAGYSGAFWMAAGAAVGAALLAGRAARSRTSTSPPSSP